MSNDRRGLSVPPQSSRAARSVATSESAKAAAGEIASPIPATRNSERNRRMSLERSDALKLAADRHEPGALARDRRHSVAAVLASLTTFALRGIDSLRVTVEVDVRR